MLKDAGIPESAVGLSALHARDGSELAGFNERTPLQPASTIKTLTAIVALETLGPAHRARTELRGPKPDAHGVVSGDVSLIGQGSVDFNAEAFTRMLAQLRLQGVQTLRGDVIIDREWFQPARGDLGETAFDETPEFQYNVIPDALTFNGNLFRLDMASDSNAVRTRITPPLDGVVVEAAMDLIDAKCADWEKGWKLPVVARSGAATDNDAATTLTIKIHGTFPKNCAANTELNVLDRADLVARFIRVAWRALGGELHGTVRERVSGEAANAYPVLAWHTGRSLAEIVRDINKRSDNPVTRVTYLELGKTITDPAARTTAELSERVVRAWLKSKGIDDAGLVLDNGSGLSRTERIPAHTLARVMWEAGKSKWAPEFMAALPIVATDGGMRNRMRNSSAKEWGRFKTGTLRDTTALTGIAPAKSGRLIVVS
ncbi:MAG: D-alanyl-D-alanine carboxypeptidase/D-alanyl-D-alanine-endopeptidase, partial [Betaproteobacteria bacterium]|nr:D-alanyl-D-alanine carboxypeptidase/D-alanyl-D-alanine-endopeptidase [Betaproteobacteria bacterium]